MRRFQDWALAISVAGWGVRYLLRPESPLIVRVALVALHAAVATLFVFRREEKRAAPWSSLVLAAPALVVSGLCLHLAPNEWPLGAQVVFATGTAFAIVALLALGRSFAILPGVRSIVRKGPYRWVRHPAYLGELVMVVGCALATGYVGWALFAITLPLVATRIWTEERVLGSDSAWTRYAQTVRWRLFPGVW